MVAWPENTDIIALLALSIFELNYPIAKKSLVSELNDRWTPNKS
jgi:hypothetical protein